MRMCMLASASALALALWATAAAAGDAAPPDGQASDVVVTGYRFLDADTSGITNLPLPVQKVPQSISLVNGDFARAADLKTMGEVAQYTPGALFASYSPSYGNQVWLRGFAANWAMDGLLVGDQITDPDPAVLQRYEVVKGPASVVYGAQSPGGVINLVSKDAAPGTPSYLEALGGSFGRWRLEGQVAGPLDAAGDVRGIVVAAHEEGGGFVDFVKLNRTVAYGGLDFHVTPTLTGYARFTYQRTQDTPFNGLPTFADGTQVPEPRSFFLGASDISATAQAYRADAGLVWTPAPLWSLDLKALYQHTTHDGGNEYNYDFIAADGSFPIGGEAFDNWHVEDFTIAGTAVRKLDDVGLSGSTLEASVRYQDYRYYISERNLSGGVANIFAGDAAVAAVFNAQTPVPGGYEQDQRMHFVTASLQAVIKVLEPLTLVGGVSYSKPDIDQQVYGGDFRSFDPGDQVNYRGALIYEPVKALDLYASYSESYLPNLRIDINHDVLPPISGRQYEVGAKYLFAQRLLLTAALFQINESNVAVYDAMVDGEALYRPSDVRHRGAELEATGQITRGWQVKGGVAWLDPVVTEDPNNPVNDGETRPWLPRATADLFTSYDFAGGFTLGGGLRYVGSVKTYDRSSARATPDLADYVVFDAMAAYTLGGCRLQLNLKNLFDERYAVSSPIFQSLSAGLLPGEPRSFAISLRKDF